MGRLAGRRAAAGQRTRSAPFLIGTVVVATIALYYEALVGGAVHVQLVATFHMSFRYLLTVSLGANLLGAVGAQLIHRTRRWGRARTTTRGLLITGLLTWFVVPQAPSRLTFVLISVAIGFVQGLMLVATQSLVRDLTPRGGRATGMALWALGPVLGAFVVTQVAHRTLPGHPDWRFQYQICGVVCVVLALAAMWGLRGADAAAGSEREDAGPGDGGYYDAAAITEPVGAPPLHGHRAHTYRRDIIVPLIGISVFTLAYGLAIGVFGLFSLLTGSVATTTDGLPSWYWAVAAFALIAGGIASDRLGVRKPFIVGGTVLSAVAVIAYGLLAGQPSASQTLFDLLVAVAVLGFFTVYSTWLAAFTETIDRRDPAGTTTVLSFSTSVARVLAAGPMSVFPVIVLAIPLLAGAVQAQQIYARYPTQLSALAALPPATQQELQNDPNSIDAQADALSQLGAPLGLTRPEVVRVLQLHQQYAPQLGVLAMIDPTTAAALQVNQNDAQAQAQALADVGQSKGVAAADVLRLEALHQKYAPQLGVLAMIDPTTAAALQANPNDAQAQAQALADVGQSKGVTAADVLRLEALHQQYAWQLATLQQLSPATQARLQADPLAALPDAVQEIAVADKINDVQALTQFVLAGEEIPPADMAFLQTKGPVVQAVGDELQTAESQIPPDDLAFLQTKGPVVQAVGNQMQTAQSQIPPDDMAFLQKEGGPMQAAGAKLQAASQIPVSDLTTLQSFYKSVASLVPHVHGLVETVAFICAGLQLVLLACVRRMAGEWRPVGSRKQGAGDVS